MTLGVKRTHKRFTHEGVDGQTAIASVALLSSASDGLHDANGLRHNVSPLHMAKSQAGAYAASSVLRQFLREFFQRLIDDHLGYPTNHALPHIGNEPAHLCVSVVGEHGLLALSGQIDRRLSFHKARRATPINRHTVMCGRRFIVQLHGPLISALDRGNAQFQSRLIRIRSYLFERLTTWQDFRNGLGIHQKGPDLLHGGIERIGAIHFHSAHPPVDKTCFWGMLAEGALWRQGWTPLMAREE